MAQRLHELARLYRELRSVGHRPECEQTGTCACGLTRALKLLHEVFDNELLSDDCAIAPAAAPPSACVPYERVDIVKTETRHVQFQTYFSPTGDKRICIAEAVTVHNDTWFNQEVTLSLAEYEKLPTAADIRAMRPIEGERAK